MTDNQNNIWNKIEVINPTDKKIKKFYKKNIKIKQIEKENILTQENNTINIFNTNKSKTMFINKKRGRKSKNINEDFRPGTHDRFCDDNLKRKIKTHFHNYIIAILNSNLNIKNQSDKLLKFGKMNSTITQNITVEYNLNLFNKQIKDIITDVSNKYQNQFINKECIDYVMKNPEDNIIVINLLNMTYKDMYLNYYLKSTKKDFTKSEVDESYEYHKEKLKKFGDKYLQNYIKNAEGLIEFYNKCKKRKSRKKDESQPNNDVEISIGNKIDKEKDSIYINNNQEGNKLILPFNNYINYFGKNLTSSSTQTDIKETGDISDDESEY
jgi:hypothetical protein